MPDKQILIETPTGFLGLLASSFTPQGSLPMVGVTANPSRKKRQRKKNQRKAMALAWRKVGSIPVHKQADGSMFSERGR